MWSNFQEDKSASQSGSNLYQVERQFNYGTKTNVLAVTSTMVKTKKQFTSIYCMQILNDILTFNFPWLVLTNLKLYKYPP